MLGLAQAIGPIGAWMAVTGRWSWTAVVLGLAVGCWIGGFDLIYALQDYEVDRRDRREVAARALRPARSHSRSRALAHYATVLLLLWFGALGAPRLDVDGGRRLAAAVRSHTSSDW